MMVKIFIPRDMLAKALGADDVTEAIAQEAAAKKISIQIIRNSSRGLAWLEPFVEIETPKGRIGYGGVKVADVKSLFDANFPEGGKHPLSQGLVEEIPFLKNQERLTFARAGITDPLSLDDYVAHGGFEGLKKALTMNGADIVKQVTESGLRGRGGAGFPTGIKWKTVTEAQADQKYVCCNADEGDSGTFVSIAAYIFLIRLGLVYGFPLDASWEASPTATAKPGRSDLLHDFSVAHHECFFQSDPAAMGNIVIQRKRICDSGACKGEAFLIF